MKVSSALRRRREIAIEDLRLPRTRPFAFAFGQARSRIATTGTPIATIAMAAATSIAANGTKPPSILCRHRQKRRAHGRRRITGKPMPSAKWVNGMRPLISSMSWSGRIRKAAGWMTLRRCASSSGRHPASPFPPTFRTMKNSKLIALNGLVDTAPDRAIPAVSDLLKKSSSPRLKERALFVLAQSRTPPGPRHPGAVRQGRRESGSAIEGGRLSRNA